MVRIEGIDLVICLAVAIFAVFFALGVGVLIGDKLATLRERNESLCKVIRANARIDALGMDDSQQEEWPTGI